MNSPEIVTAIISAFVTLVVSVGTWHITMKQYRLKNMDMVEKAIDDVKDSMTANISQIQMHLVEMDMKIETLSDRTDKHNNLIDRMYAVEKKTDINERDIEELKKERENAKVS